MSDRPPALGGGGIGCATLGAALVVAGLLWWGLIAAAATVLTSLRDLAGTFLRLVAG